MVPAPHFRPLQSGLSGNLTQNEICISAPFAPKALGQNWMKEQRGTWFINS